MDWGLGNPNKTAALIAILMIAIWILAYVRKWGFWAALVFFIGLGVCLIHTFSRGGLIALFAGLIPLIVVFPRPWLARRVIAIALGCWIIIGTAIFFNADDRYSQGIVREDHSITNRFEIWKSVPRMIIDAPEGWGLGKSGIAYTQWYQPVDNNELYRTLVNSHLTLLVELNWLGRFVYISGWIVLFLLCWPTLSARWLSIPFGIWLSFAVSATFSSVAESLWLWIVPILSLLWVLAYRIKQKCWPRLRYWKIGLGTAIATYLALLILGILKHSVIHKKDGQIIYGNQTPNTWILVNTKIIGKDYGHTFREAIQKASVYNVGFIENSAQLPSVAGKELILMGKLPRKDSAINSASSLLIVNPEFSPTDIGIDQEHNRKIRVMAGEFSQLPFLEDWKRTGNVQFITGCGEFLPGWPSKLLVSEK